MNRKRKMLLIIALLLFGGCLVKNNTPTGSSLFVPAEIDEMLNAHNKERGNKSPLILNDKLMQAAQKHAEWMAENKKMSHTGYRRSQPADRVDKEGYKWRGVAENVAYGYPTVNDVMKGWMNSSGHKRNILGNYKDVGFGIAKTPSGTIYWASVFANPQEEWYTNMEQR